LYSGFKFRVQNVLQEGTVCGHCIPLVQGAFYPKKQFKFALWLHIIGNTSYMYLKEFHILLKHLKEIKRTVLVLYCLSGVCRTF